MRIVFFGEDSFSNVVLQSLIDSNYDIVLVVSPFYENFRHKRLERNCIQNGIEYLRFDDFKSSSFIDIIKSYLPDLIVITHFEKLLPNKIIEIPSRGCINLHPSLLPNYRGMSPQHWPIIQGESETGITIHFIDEKADTGDIILQKKIPINDLMYVSDLQIEFIKVYSTIMIEAIELIMDSSFIPIKQSHLTGSYFGKLKEYECQILLDKSKNDIFNLIRGVSKPYFGAYIDNLRIWKAHLANTEELIKLKHNGDLKIGINHINELGYILVLNDGILIIDKYETI